MTPKYGSLEGHPVRFIDDEAWVFAKNAWHPNNSAEVLVGAHVMSEAEFRKDFGELPPLPSKAFHGSIWDPQSREERQIIDVVEKDFRRPLTEREINLSLEHARTMGDLSTPVKAVAVLLTTMEQQEKEIIAYIEKSKGRPLTKQEINLSLEQARAMGDLSERVKTFAISLTAILPKLPAEAQEWVNGLDPTFRSSTEHVLNIVGEDDFINQWQTYRADLTKLQNNSG